LLCGIAAAGAQFAADPQSPVPMIGASGAVSGVLGAYLLLYPRARVTVLIPIWIFFKFVEVPALVMLVIWFGLQLLSGLFTPPGHAGVAFWAHIGGFVAGLALVVFFKKRRVRLFGG
jgi:membrane associated rhomboid family serine protease